MKPITQKTRFTAIFGLVILPTFLGVLLVIASYTAFQVLLGDLASLMERAMRNPKLGPNLFELITDCLVWLVLLSALFPLAKKFNNPYIVNTINVGDGRRRLGVFLGVLTFAALGFLAFILGIGIITEI